MDPIISSCMELGHQSSAMLGSMLPALSPPRRPTWLRPVSVCPGPVSLLAGVDQGLGVARVLDESGAVFVLGDVVFLRRFTNLSRTLARSGVFSAASDSAGAPVVSAASSVGAHTASSRTLARHFCRFPCSSHLFWNRHEDPDLACSSRPMDLPRPADLQRRGIRLPPLWSISTVLIFPATVAGSPFPARRRSYLAEDSVSANSPFKTLALGFLVEALSLAMEGLEMEGEMPYLPEDEATGEDVTAREDLIIGVLNRFHSSTRNDHQHLCAAVGTMVQALKDQGIPLTPIAYFGTIASSLDHLSCLRLQPCHHCTAFLPHHICCHRGFKEFDWLLP